MKTLRGILLLLLVCSCHFICAQSLIVNTFTIKDGLPSSAIRSINQDIAGRIWIVTDNGVAKYTGTDNGLSYNIQGNYVYDVFDVWPSSSGKIFLIDYKKDKHYIYNDSVYAVKGTSNYIYMFSEYNGIVYGVDFRNHKSYMVVGDTMLNIEHLFRSKLDQFSGKDEVFFSFPYFFYVGKDVIRTLNIISDKLTTRRNLGMDTSVTAKVFCYNHNLYLRTDNTRLIIYNAPADKIIAKDFTKKGTVAFNIRQIMTNEENTQITTDNGLLVLDKTFNEIDSINLDTRTAGLISIFQDKAGNYWLLTRDGLKFIGAYFKDMVLYPEMQGKKIAVFKDEIYVLNDNDDLSVYDRSFNFRRLLRIPDVGHGQYHNFSALIENRDSMIVVTNRNISVLNANGGMRHLKSVNRNRWALVSAKNCFAHRDGLYVVSHDGIYLADLRTGLATAQFKGGYNRVFLDEQGNIFASDIDDFYMLKQRARSLLGDAVIKLAKQQFGRKVPDIISNQDDNWIATYNNYFVTLNTRTGKSFYQLFDEKILFVKYEDTHLWVATRSRLFRYSLQHHNYALENVYYNFRYNLYENLADIAGLKDHFLILSNHGVIKIPYSHRLNIDSNFRNSLFVEKIKHGKDYTYNEMDDSSISLTFSSDNTSMYLSTNTLSYDKQVTYRYKLEGADRQWQSTGSPILTYPSLGPGTYTLYIVASLPQYDLYSREYRLKITIKPLWWQRSWIIPLAVFLLSIGLWFAVLRILLIRKNRLLKQALTEKNILGLKLNALQSQMNPHFIFNALTSIQGFLRKNNKAVAEVYLREFATLIRMYLEFSRKQLITIEEEIAALKLYTGIEEKRFDGRFDVNFSVEGIDNPGVLKIPPLIIQPFVENAIVHGLYHKLDGKGRLNITFIGHSNRLIVKIEDNGIGRAAAGVINKAGKRRRSLGIAMVYERLRILNEQNNITVSLTIEDKMGKTFKPEGTMVQLQFDIFIS